MSPLQEVLQAVRERPVPPFQSATVSGHRLAVDSLT